MVQEQRDKLVSANAVLTSFRENIGGAIWATVVMVAEEILARQPALGTTMISAEDLGKMVPLKEVSATETFNIGRLPFAPIKKMEFMDATMVQAQVPISYAAFDEDGNNNWVKSSLRRILNGPWRKKFTSNNPELAQAMVRFPRSLDVYNGRPSAYGTFIDWVSLLTMDEFSCLNTTENIPQWLITPWQEDCELGISANSGKTGQKTCVDKKLAIYPVICLKNDLMVLPTYQYIDEFSDLVMATKEY